MKLGQTVYYIDRYTHGHDGPDVSDQFHHIDEGKYLSEDSEMTAVVTAKGNHFRGEGVVIFVPNDQVTEDDDTRGRMSIVDAILARHVE